MTKDEEDEKRNEVTEESQVDESQTADNNQTDEDTSNTANDTTSEIENLKKQVEEEKYKKLSLMADFQNYQNRVMQEKSAWGALGNMALIQDLLEIYDDLELALSDEQLNLDHAKVSMKSAQDKLIGSALKAGVEKVDVKVGDDFDKEKMEAVSMVPVQDEKQKGKIVAVISSAYRLTNREGILKPAKVVVGK